MAYVRDRSRLAVLPLIRGGRDISMIRRTSAFARGILSAAWIARRLVSLTGVRDVVHVASWHALTRCTCVASAVGDVL